MLSGLSVFVNAETNIHIEIRVENFQLEQPLSDINQLNTLSLTLSAIQPALCSPHVELADFISLWPCIVCHYRWLRSPTRPPLATINQPFSKSAYIESSDHVPCLSCITGSFVESVLCCGVGFTNRYRRELRTVRFKVKNSTASAQTVFMCSMWISGKQTSYSFPVQH